jgi:hypothetical protein
MTSRLTSNKFIFYMVLITFAVGCTTMQSVPAIDAQSLASQIEVGDEISIVRNDLTDVTFDVDVVSDEGIGGDGVFVAYADIRQVQVRQFNTGKTVGFAAILVALVITIGSSDIGISGDFFGPPPEREMCF